MTRLVRIIVFSLLVLALPGYAHAQTAVYHLHKESSTTSGLLQLKTSGPDYRETALQSAELKSQPAGEYLVKAFDTPAGVPNFSGAIPAGSTMVFTLWMKKTASFGTMYPRAKLNLNNASGVLFCTVTGAAAVTTTLAPYTFTCTTASNITMTAADRLYLWVGVNLAAGPGANRVKAELDIEGALNGNYDSRIVVARPTISSLSPISGPVGTSVTITGVSFGATQGTSTVSFNGTAATASNWSNTTIVATVPSGVSLSTGPVVVTVGGAASNGVPFSVDLLAGFITTVAGNGLSGYSGDGGPAATAQLWRPSGVALDVQGNLFIADSNNFRIRSVDTNGIITTVAGNGTWGYSGDGGPATAAQLGYPYSPYRVVVDAQGNLFIADSSNQRIRKVNTSGIITTVAGNGVAGYSGDGGVATSAQLNNPVGVAVDVQGTLFIADQNNHRIRKVNAAGTITTVAGTGIAGFNGDGISATNAQLNNPLGVAVDAQGTLFIADSSNKRIRKVDTTGIIATVAGNGTYGYSGDGGPATSAQLSYPYAVAVDGQGTMFIADNQNHRIRKVSLNGTITTVAGSGAIGLGFGGYSGDGGPATAAQLNLPEGVAIDSQRNIFIADSSNERVRKVGAALLPTVSSLSPTSGPVGASVTIDGTNFGTTQGIGKVMFNGLAATVSNWSNTSITAMVPVGATTGLVTVTTDESSNGILFTVLPRITSLSPSSAPLDSLVAINGSNFGAVQGNSTVTFNGVTAVPTRWESSIIVAPVPAGATSGPVVVTVEGAASNSLPFTVTPGIKTLSPGAGPVGASVTITGSSFGTAQGSSTVTFNGVPATPSSWSETSIVATVPDATSGPVVVTVGGIASNAVSFTVLRITITIPANGEVINRPKTVVMGRLPNLAGDLTVIVNDRLAMVNGLDFAINGVDLSLGDNTITVTMTDQAGLTVTASVLVRSETQDTYLDMTAGLESALTTMTTDVMLEPFFSSPVTETVVDITGPGPSYTTLPGLPSGLRVSLYSPGMYLVTVTARTAAGPYVNRLAFMALDPTATEALLRQKWDAMWAALLAGNVDGALTYFVTRSHERYRSIFTELQPSLPQLYGGIEAFHLLSVTNDEAEAEAIRTEGGIPYSYPINYYWGEDGVWKLRQF